MINRIGIVLLCVVAVGASTIVPARAHAIVQETEPAIDAVVDTTPERVVMRFNEPIEVAFGAIRVYDTTGERVDTAEVDYVPGEASAVTVGLQPDLPDGTYTVTWRVISADSHVISEAFVFHVGAPGARPEGIARQVLSGGGNSSGLGALFGVVRALGFASLLMLVGALFFLLYVWRVVGAEDPSQRFHRGWKRVLAVGWLGGLATSLLMLPLQAAQAGGLGLGEGFSPAALSDVVATRFGTLMLVRSLVLLAGLAAWFWLRRRLTSPDGIAEAVAAVFVLGVLTCTALAGHAGSSPPVAVNVPVDVLHLLGVSAWTGGLTVLVAAVFPAFRQRDAHELGGLVARYSDVAVVAVAVVVVTGVWQSFVEVKSLGAFDTTYGFTLLAKIAIFIVLLGLGAVNNRWAKPRIERAADAERGVSVLKRLVAVEVALAVVVVGVTAFLVNLPPARVAAGIDGPFVTDVAFGEDELNVLVDPNRVGENEIHLTVTTAAGAAAEMKEMRVLFTMPAESIGPLIGRATELAKGHFVVQGNQLSVPGKWTLEVIGRISRFDEVRVRVPVTVNS